MLMSFAFASETSAFMDMISAVMRPTASGAGCWRACADSPRVETIADKVANFSCNFFHLTHDHVDLFAKLRVEVEHPLRDVILQANDHLIVLRREGLNRGSGFREARRVKVQ